MNNFDYVAGHVADLTGTSAQQVADTMTRAPGQSEPYKVMEEKPRFDPAGMAVEEGRGAIIANVKAQEEQKKVLEQQGRFAAAVAEALRPTVEVGKVNREGKVVGVPLDPPTNPEPRETIQAGIAAVGTGGRKGVFSELPFEAEDIPKGWEVIATKDGGYLATPEEHAQEAIRNELTDKRHETLGYSTPKPQQADAVVQLKDSMGRTVQDEAVDQSTQQTAIEKALDVAGQIGGSVDMKSVPEVIKERDDKLNAQVHDDTFKSFGLVEGVRPEVYEDSQGLKTVGVGFNMEQKGARKMWAEAGIQTPFDKVYNGQAKLTEPEMKALLSYTLGGSNKKAMARAQELGVDWNKLPEWHKAILTDIAFNTGSVSGWSQVFKATSPKQVLRQARRLEGGKHTSGMDNRVARIGLMLGIINSVSEAKALGLTLTNLTDKELASIIKDRAKAQPTQRLS